MHLGASPSAGRPSMLPVAGSAPGHRPSGLMPSRGSSDARPSGNNLPILGIERAVSSSDVKSTGKKLLTNIGSNISNRIGLTKSPSQHAVQVVEEVKKQREPSFRQQLLKKTLAESVTRPSGVLAVHIKQGRIYDIDSRGKYFPSEGASVGVYLRLHSTSQCKFSGMFVDLATPVTVVFDDLLQFDFTVDPSCRDAYYFLRIEMIGFDVNNPGTHRILAMKEFSQLDLIQLRFTSQTVELWKLDRLVADVNIEFAFAYGSFGFGYSNVFMRQTTRPPKDFIEFSMFCRLAPPFDRPVAFDGEVMQCGITPRQPPDILYLTCKTVFDISHLVAGSSMMKVQKRSSTRIALVAKIDKENKEDESPEPNDDLETSSLPLITTILTPRIIKLRADFSRLTSRHDRLDFLRQKAVVGANEAQIMQGSEELKVEKQPALKQRYRQYRRAPGIFGERNDEEMQVLVAAVPSLVQLAGSGLKMQMSGSSFMSNATMSATLLNNAARSPPSTIESTESSSTHLQQEESADMVGQGQGHRLEQGTLWQRFVGFFTGAAQPPTPDSEYWRKRR